MTSKSQRAEESAHDKEPEVRREPSKKRDKSKVREPSCPPSLVGRAAGEEEEEGTSNSQLGEKITGVEAELRALNRRIVVIEDNTQLDERSIRVEAGLTSLNTRIVVVEDSLRSLESVTFDGLDEVKGNLAEFEEVHKEGMTSLELRLTKTISFLQREIEALKRQVDEAAETRVATPVTVRETRIEAPKPKEFRGDRSAQDVENFIWQMEAYFEHVGMLSEAAKVRTATMYLTDTAMLWWRRKKADMERGACRIDNWEQFKSELKRQFYPQNVVHEARRKLRELKQTSSIREYVEEFTKLTLQIPSMHPEELRGTQERHSSS